MKYEKRADESGHIYFKRYTLDNHPNYDPLPHFHGSIEVFFVERGEYIIYIEGKEHVLGAGDISFIDRFTPHTSRASNNGKDFSVYVLVASDEYLGNICNLRTKTLPTIIRCEQKFSTILEIVKSSHQLFADMNEDAKVGFISLILGLLYSTATPLSRKENPSGEIVCKILKYIGENYQNEITLQGIARHFGYDEAYLSRSFNKAINMNLREYINRVRIAEVKRKKEADPALPLYLVAESCGFRSQNTFYRALKKYG